MFVDNTVNTQDAAQAKAYLFGHSRVVTEGIYINKFCKGSIQRKKGLTNEEVAGAFDAALLKASKEMADLTGYGIAHDKKRFILVLPTDAEDKAGLFTGSQMKLNSLSEEQLMAQADIIMAFDKLCDQVVDEFCKEVKAEEAAPKAEGTETEGADDETEATEEAADETEAGEETEEAGETEGAADETEEAGETEAEGTVEETETEEAGETEKKQLNQRTGIYGHYASLYLD